MGRKYFKDEQVHAIEFAIMEQLDKASSAMIEYMNSDMTIPMDTHNMKDGLGVAIYNNGRLGGLAFSKRATESRADEPRKLGQIKGKHYGLTWGRDLIQELLDEGSTKYSEGIWIVLLSAMPYDIFQDSEGINKGWFSISLGDKFKELVFEIMREFGNEDK